MDLLFENNQAEKGIIKKDKAVVLVPTEIPLTTPKRNKVENLGFFKKLKDKIVRIKIQRTSKLSVTPKWAVWMKLTVNVPKTAESNPTSFPNKFFPKKNKSKIETEDANAEINLPIKSI